MADAKDSTTATSTTETQAAATAPVESTPVTAAPATTTEDSTTASTVPEGNVKLRSRLKYSVGIDLSDGDHLSLPAHATRTIEAAKLVKDGKDIELPVGVVKVKV
jgi:hypothetical protein